MSLDTSTRTNRPGPKRAPSLLAVAALALVLALGGCRGGAARNNGGGGSAQGAVTTTSSASGASNSSATGSSNSLSIQQLQNLDNQSQSATQGMNAAQNNAGVNYSSQENNQVP